MSFVFQLVLRRRFIGDSDNLFCIGKGLLVIDRICKVARVGMGLDS